MASYQFTVQCYNAERRPGCSTVGGCRDTLSEILAEAFKEASYYIHVCGYAVTVEINERCQKCNGTGFIGKRTPKKCTHCDWGFIQAVAPFPVELHPNAVEQLAGTSVA